MDEVTIIIAVFFGIIGLIVLIKIISSIVSKTKAEQAAEKEALHETLIEEKFKSNEMVQKTIAEAVEQMYNDFLKKVPPEISKLPRGDYDQTVCWNSNPQGYSFRTISYCFLCSYKRIGIFSLHEEGYPSLSMEEQNILRRVMLDAVKPQIISKIQSYFREHHFGNDMNAKVEIFCTDYENDYSNYYAYLNITYTADNGNFKGFKSW